MTLFFKMNKLIEGVESLLDPGMEYVLHATIEAFSWENAGLTLRLGARQKKLSSSR
jgi:hypothetical protein